MIRALLITLLLTVQVSADDIVDKIQGFSVTLRSGTSSGSGVLFTRKDGEDIRTFVWSAAHVIDNLRKTREVFVRGDRKTVVEFSDASIVSEFYEDGRRIGESQLDAKVLRYSDADNGEDLALLEVRKRNFVPMETSVEFYDGETPKIGSELYHVGSLLGGMGANSLTTGVLSKVGRVLDLGANGKTFDQSTTAAFPGSSGGGVFLKSDGKCIGLLVRGAGESFTFIVPVRRMREWAKEANVEWAMDRNVPMPAKDQLDSLPIEDADSIKLNRETPVDVEFPFLIKRDK